MNEKLQLLQNFNLLSLQAMKKIFFYDAELLCGYFLGRGLSTTRIEIWKPTFRFFHSCRPNVNSKIAYRFFHKADVHVSGKLFCKTEKLYTGLNYLSVTSTKNSVSGDHKVWDLMEIFGSIPAYMGAIWWGHGGCVPPTFSDGGDIICHVPPTFFSLGFVFCEISKIEVMFVTFCVKSFSC